MNELQLTKESIANEGIEIKITQADVIDALVEEQMEAINSRHQLIIKTKELIQQKIDAIKLLARDKAIALLESKLPKMVSVDAVTKRYGSCKTTGKTVYLETVKSNSDHTGIRYDLRDSTSISSKVEYLEDIPVNVNIKGLEIEGSSIQIRYNVSIPPSIFKDIEEHNLVCRKFATEFPEKINPTKISKSIKNKFTKEILKTSSADFRNKLKTGFGVTL